MTIVASAGENNELGRDGDLCWHLPEDLRHFKELTLGGVVIMGRNTWESLPKKPLPGRINIVISRSFPETITGQPQMVVPSLEVAIERARELPESSDGIFIIGGGSVYNQAILTASRLELTRIFATCSDADTFFPEIDPAKWSLEDSSDIMTAKNGLKYQYLSYQRLDQ